MVSICVPAYKKPAYVARLLEAVLQQSYKDVEVVITDDSPDDSVKIAIEPYKNQLNIQYFHNVPAQGSPMNWNKAISLSQGDYFVLMHQDDWFHDPHAISLMLNSFEKDPNIGFVFCKNTAQKPDGSYVVLQGIPSLPYQLKHFPNRLVLAQVIGPPSNIMLRKEVKEKVQYDERFIWFVDVDYNVSLIKAGFDYAYIDQHLVTIGLHKDQTTEFVGENLDIKFRENIWFAAKMGAEAFRDWKIFDYYWRLLRNFKIRDEKDFQQNKLPMEEVVPVLLHMFHGQKRVPYFLLRLGLFSKIFMFLNFITWKLK